ncbi:hypothetical protein [Noviherbaspirillum aerium]|nr:hypothetical protein [Noviherbaspirillum aerium]
MSRNREIKERVGRPDEPRAAEQGRLRMPWRRSPASATGIRLKAHILIC